MRRLLLAIPLLLSLPLAAWSQPSPGGARPGNDVGTGMSLPLGDRASNLSPQDTRSTIAPNLPAPLVGPDQRPSQYLLSAQGALAAGRTGEAQQALEMAQTRMLDRSVPMGQTKNPNDNPTVQQISLALRALAEHDRSACLTQIQAAIGSATAQGL